MKPLLACIILLLFCNSCEYSGYEENKTTERVSVLPFDTTITADRIISFEGETTFINPLRILNIDDRFLIVTEYRPNDFFQVFSLPELDFMYSAGEKGRGPNEFITTPTYFNVDDDGQLITYDPLLNRLRFFEVNDTNLIEIKYESLAYNGQLEPLNSVRRLNDSTYFAEYGSSIEKTNREHIALKPNVTDSLF